MSFFNMPAGCLGPSDIDHYTALNHEPKSGDSLLDEDEGDFDGQL